MMDDFWDITGCGFEFDFDKLISDAGLISWRKEYHEYLDNWNGLFHKLKLNFNSELEKMLEKSQKSNFKYKTYQYTQGFPRLNSEYVYNFDVERILSQIDYSEYRFISMKRLIRCADYHEVKLDNRKTKKEPVILCPFTLPESSHIVIDGNTRLTYRIKKHYLFTRVIIYRMYNKDDFIFSVDWAMYWFVNEVNRICQYKDRPDFPTYIKDSILYSDKFKKELIF